MKKILFTFILILSFISYVESLSFSPDGRYIVSGNILRGTDEYSMEAIIRIWDTETGQQIRSFSAGGAWGISLVFSPDSSKIISVTNWSESTNVILWDVASGKIIREMGSLGAHCGGSSIEFNSNGSQIISGSWEGTVKIHDISTGREIRTFSGNPLSFSPDGRQVLSVDGNIYIRGNTIRLWDVSTGCEIRTFSGNFASFSPDGRQILFIDGNTIKLWDMATGREIKTFFTGSSVFTCLFNPDIRHIVSRHIDNKVITKLWNIETGREAITFSGYIVSFSPDGKQMLSVDGNKIKLWDVSTGREIRPFSGNSALFSPDGRQFLFSSWDEGIINLWDISTSRVIRTFSGNSALFSPDGSKMLTSDDDTIKLWDTATGKEIAQLKH